MFVVVFIKISKSSFQEHIFDAHFILLYFLSYILQPVTMVVKQDWW